MQRFGKTLISAPATQPITQSMVIAQIYGDDDLPTEQTDLITSIIKACTAWAEDFCCSRFVTQTWDYKFDYLCYGEMEIPYGPLQSITSISYLDVNGTSQTLSSTLYLADTTSFIPKIYPAYAAVYPAVQDIQNAVTIRAIQGYGAASAVPDPIIHALKLLAAHFYQKREPVMENIQLSHVPMTVQTLLAQNRKSWL